MDWVLIVAVGWLLAAVLLGLLIGRAIHLAGEQEPRRNATSDDAANPAPALLARPPTPRRRRTSPDPPPHGVPSSPEDAIGH